MSQMRTIRLKISDLFEFGEQAASTPPDLATVTVLVLKQFRFLPQPVLVQIEGDEVVIQCPEEPAAAQAEAARLAERAGKRAAEGNYAKAIGILKRVLELQPSLHTARRDLAMAYVEAQDIERQATEDRRDALSYVISVHQRFSSPRFCVFASSR